MKEFIQIIKKLWQNKRTRAIAILLLYIVFFLFVFSVLSPSNKNTNKNTTPTDEFYYLNNVEIVSYNVYDPFNNLLEDYDTSLINNSIIYNVVKSSVLESTNYIDNSNTYSISVKDFEKIINNVSIEQEGMIRTTISDTNIILDFTQYYGYKINIDIRS